MWFTKDLLPLEDNNEVGLHVKTNSYLSSGTCSSCNNSSTSGAGTRSRRDRFNSTSCGIFNRFFMVIVRNVADLYFTTFVVWILDVNALVRLFKFLAPEENLSQ